MDGEMNSFLKHSVRSFQVRAVMVLVLLTLGRATLIAATIPKMKYDRMQIAGDFLHAIYLDLNLGYGQLSFFTWPQMTHTFYVNFLPCHPGSGVPAGGKKWPFGQCPGPEFFKSSSYLTAMVAISDKDRLIRSFGAGGEFVTGKMDIVKKEVVEHPEWKEGEMLDVLRQAEPRFGPDHREVFLKSVPVETIYKYTGCRLNLTHVNFWVARLGTPPDPPEIHLEWNILGTSSRNGRCSATFEPFDGKLTGLLN
jgi:hypothetical protein